jgi:hypothetical protein
LRYAAFDSQGFPLFSKTQESVLRKKYNFQNKNSNRFTGSGLIVGRKEWQGSDLPKKDNRFTV